jgi:hypothetical protein
LTATFHFCVPFSSKAMTAPFSPATTVSEPSLPVPALPRAPPVQYRARHHPAQVRES